MTNYVEVNKNAVLEAAEKHPEAKPVLKTIFPELFPDKKYTLPVIFTRSRYRNIYAVVVEMGHYVVKNLNCNKNWKDGVVIPAPWESSNPDQITESDLDKLLRIVGKEHVTIHCAGFTELLKLSTHEKDI